MWMSQAGPSPLQLGAKAEERGKLQGNPLSFLIRLLLGSAAGFYYFLVSINHCIVLFVLYCMIALIHVQSTSICVGS
jgi:hypothetical protein